MLARLHIGATRPTRQGLVSTIHENSADVPRTSRPSVTASAGALSSCLARDVGPHHMGDKPLILHKIVYARPPKTSGKPLRGRRALNFAPRFVVLMALLAGYRTVSAIRAATGVSRPDISGYLRIWGRRGWVERDRERNVFQHFVDSWFVCTPEVGA